jgi:hypothetical protein
VRVTVFVSKQWCFCSLSLHVKVASSIKEATRALRWTVATWPLNCQNLWWTDASKERDTSVSGRSLEHIELNVL